MGLERKASSGNVHFTLLVLIATLAGILLWLIETAAKVSVRTSICTPAAVDIAHTRTNFWLGRCCRRSRAGRPPQA